MREAEAGFSGGLRNSHGLFTHVGTKREGHAFNHAVSGDGSRWTVLRRGRSVRTIRPRGKTKEIVGSAPIGTVKTAPFRRNWTFTSNPG
jgi:hypothetical protein